MYADIQCHPGAAAYDQARLADGSKDKTPFDPWQIPQSDLLQQTSGKRAIGYSQGDLAKSITAEARLLFTALYPVEKGFLAGLPGGRIGKKLVAEFYRRVRAEGEGLAIEWLLSHLRTQPGLETLEKSSLDFLQNRAMNFSLERVRTMQSGQYDYFEELKREYKFYRSKMGQPGATPELQLQPNGVKKKWGGTYYLVKSATDFQEKFNPVCDEIMMVLTIEGIHSLGVGNLEDESLHDGETPFDVTVGKLKSRIRQLKGEESLDDAELPYWEHCPFFITLAHHFNNTLCGHARSFPSVSKMILDQRKNMDRGIMKQGTYEVMQELLGLDENLIPTGSKRILIDIKHMSAASRSDYYRYLIRPFNYNSANKTRKIPVIASNVGYSGIDRLEVQTINARMEKEDDHFRVNGFLAWSINLTDEDVIEVHHSHGLIGISFDQHLLGANSQSWWMNLPWKRNMRLKATQLFARTIAQLVSIPFAYNMDEPLRIWETLCVGTGFDGATHPANRYATVLDFRTFEEDLVKILARLKSQEPIWFGCHQPAHLARMICFENAADFVKRNYN